jgi:hypothetical protein
MEDAKHKQPVYCLGSKYRHPLKWLKAFHPALGIGAGMVRRASSVIHDMLE